MNREPVAIIGAIIAALTVVQDALTSGLSPASAILPAVVALLTYVQRSKVYPSESVRGVSVDAYLQGAYDTAIAKRDNSAD